MIEDTLFWILEKTVFYIFLPLLLLFLFVGIPALIWYSYQEYNRCDKWESKIVHQEPWTQYVLVGKVMTPIYHPAKDVRENVCVKPK